VNHERSALGEEVIEPLERSGLLVDVMTSSSRKWQGITIIPTRRGTDSHLWADIGDRLMDIRFSRGAYRRLDIRQVQLILRMRWFAHVLYSFAPMGSRGAATLLLTGDPAFLRSLRLKAKSLGLYLNEYGLWRLRPTKAGSNAPADDADADVSADTADSDNSNKEPPASHWEFLEGESEEKILELLDQGWVEPEKRNFRFLKPASRGKSWYAVDQDGD